MGELGDVERSDARDGIVIDEGLQGRLIADLRNKLTEDAMFLLFLLGVEGVVCLVLVISTWRSLSVGSGNWLGALAVVLTTLLFTAIVYRLRSGPRKVVYTSYPIGSVVEAGSDGRYLWQASVLGSTRVVLDVYRRMWLTADSVILRPRSSPLTMILPRGAFMEESVKALEAHFAPKSGR